MWDNAYSVHDLGDKPDKLANLMDAARAKSTTSSVIMLASTSKVTFAGAGISFIGMEQNNLVNFERFLVPSMIGPDKVNQLRHVRFLKDSKGIEDHMARHREIIRPRFELTQRILENHLGGKDIATWTQPNGGYFVSLNTQPGLASEIVEMAGSIGVKLTPAGATFPYGKDPEDRNIRIAPTYASIDQLQVAMEVLIVCLQLVTVKQFIDKV
jgi:DNA-binding transcriptional MocR family regulator